jgi:hypothetical protein
LLVTIASDLQALYFAPLSTSFKITSTDFLELIHACKKLEVRCVCVCTCTCTCTSTITLSLMSSCAYAPADAVEVLDLGNYHFEMDPLLLDVSKFCENLTTLLLDGIGMTDYGYSSLLTPHSSLFFVFPLCGRLKPSSYLCLLLYWYLYLYLCLACTSPILLPPAPVLCVTLPQATKCGTALLAADGLTLPLR